MDQFNENLAGRTLPDLGQYINQAVSAPIYGCPEINTYGVNQLVGTPTASSSFPIKNDPNEYPFGNPLEGALRILASKYQTCQILDNVGGTPQFTSQSPEVLEEWIHGNPPTYPLNQPSCTDSTKLKKKITCQTLENGPCQETSISPLQYSQGWRYSNIKNNTMMVQESASDCSSFVSSAMMAVGLKMSTSSTKSDYTATTASINEEFRSSKSCFERKKSRDPKNLISSGDILNDSKGGHVVMIDYVGNDPFGAEAILYELATDRINKQVALQKCQSIELSRMNIGIIHSSYGVAGNGIIRERANVISSDTAENILVSYARGACASFVDNYPLQKEYNSADSMCSTCAVLHHKGKKNPDCVFEEKPKIQGEECINECLQTRI